VQLLLYVFFRLLTLTIASFS